MENFALVIPVHNACPQVTRLLSQLPQTEVSGIPQVLVDDASDQETHAVLVKYARKFSNVALLTNPTQQLFTRSLNRGIRAMTPPADYLFLLNSDCQVKPGFANKMLDCIEAHPNAAMIGYPDGIPHKADPEKVEHPGYVTGHSLLIPAWALYRLGVFCETDTAGPLLGQAHISSERLWCWKALQAGYEAWYVHSDLCIHDDGGPSWGRDLAWLQRFPRKQLWAGRDTL